MLRKQVHIKYRTDTEADLYAEMPFDLMYIRQGNEPELVPEQVGEIFKIGEGWYVWSVFSTNPKTNISGPYDSAIRAAKVIQRDVNKVWH